MRSPQQFRNPLMNMAAGFNPMMNMAMLNPHFQFQQMMMQQQLQRQQMTQQRSNTGQSNIPPETQKPPVGYVCFKCGQPGMFGYERLRRLWSNMARSLQGTGFIIVPMCRKASLSLVLA